MVRACADDIAIVINALRYLPQIHLEFTVFEGLSKLQLKPT